ncbi:hypothetical protein [Noviherbaspirillum pedocola]|uniref:Uncharacterized protein n=1 Tax=Noviherbaspirillum pedocola TaxID=2801341 RepID=A0A934SX39_9BURK|nr:hypothetical protein [Noviherbaspirillum pedocola]MBK4737254.1 hypothetical protein [Noviherbaspirillum pedocola]
MITEQAKAGFEQLLVSALKSRLPLSCEDTCEITPVTANDSIATSANTVVVLTISGIRFRLLFFLEVEEKEDIRFYYAANGQSEAFKEAFLEVSNLCCGLLSQGLQAHFPDLGMSTPYILRNGCLAHLTSLKQGYLTKHAVTINGSMQMLATICVCEYADIDFMLSLATAEVEVDSGELELF